MAKNELSRLRGLLLADVKAREQILDILNKLEEMDLNNTDYIEEISTKLLALNKFSTKEEYEATNNELNNLLLQIDELSEFKNLIPDTANPENQLVDKNFLNSSISTATAEFRGTVENLETLNSLLADKNDYAFYKHTDESGNTVFDRYKFTDKWEYEYTLNNSSFTAEQWATINSGLTAKVLDDLAADTERELEKKVNYTDIVDALNSEETSKPLSAKMGKELKTQVDTKAELEYVNEELNKKASNNQVDEKINDVKEYVNGALNNHPTNSQVDAALENYAKKDGYYETFGYAREAGVAKNLQSDKDKLLDPDVTISSGAVYADQPFTQRATAMTMKAYLDNELITVGSGYEQWRKEQAFSIVRNNQAPHTNSKTNGITATYDPSTRIFTLSGTSTSDYTNLSEFPTSLYEHKILMVFQLISNPNNISQIEYAYFNQLTKTIKTNGVIGTYGIIISPSSSALRYQGVKGFSVGTDLTGIQFRIIQIDLTQWFASRPEIATALNGDEGVKWFLQNYPEALTLGYDEGTIVDTEDYDYETTGVNLWDEEWENGTFDTSTGANISNNQVRSKNPINVFPNTEYYFNPSLDIWVMFLDINMQPIPLAVPSGYSLVGNSVRLGNTDNRQVFTTPNNAVYCKFYCQSGYGSTYNNDIQICQHFTETSVEQTYHKYEIFKDRVSWAFTSTGKGKSAGLVADTKDYVNKKNIEKVGQVDLGTLNWIKDTNGSNWGFYVKSISGAKVVSSNEGIANFLNAKYKITANEGNANYTNDKVMFQKAIGQVFIVDKSYQTVEEFKAAMSGVILNYELETPIETDMEADELDASILENEYGIERKVPVSGDMFSGSATTILYQDIVWKQIYNNKSLIDTLRVDVDTLENRIPDAGENTVSTHNTSSTAHSDIRTLVLTAQTTADNAQTKANEIEELIVKNGVIDGSPKGVYADLSALQTAFPSGASGVYLTSDNGHWYYWNGSAWTDGGVYHTTEIADGSVSLNKTDFATTGKNLFNKMTAKDGYYIAYTSGNIFPNAEFFASDYICLKEGQTHLTLQPVNAYQLAFYDTNKHYIGGEYYSNNQNGIISIPSNAKYVRFSLRIVDKDFSQLEYGQTRTTYESYYDDFIYPKNNETSGKITLKENLIDLNNIIQNKYYNSSSSIVNGSGCWIVNKVIKLKPNTRYCLFPKYVFYQNFCWLNERPNASSTQSNISNFGYTYDNGSFTTDETHIYLYITFRAEPIDTFKLMEGDVPNNVVISGEPQMLGQFEPRTFYVGANRQFTKLKDGVEYASQFSNALLIVDDGEYDLVNEYGQDYLDNNTSDKGLKLKNGLHIKFSSGSKVTFHYTGVNSFIHTQFSPFNTSVYGGTLENLTLECSNCRYAVHDERGFTTDRYINKFINCVMSLDNSNNPDWTNPQNIGGGLGKDGLVEIVGCVFNNAVTYHNNGANVESKSKVIIKDCYLQSNGIIINGYGSSTEKSVFIITNTHVDYISVNNDIDNVVCYQWNNDIY